MKSTRAKRIRRVQDHEQNRNYIPTDPAPEEVSSTPDPLSNFNLQKTGGKLPQLTPANASAMQNLIGNRAVARLIASQRNQTTIQRHAGHEDEAVTRIAEEHKCTPGCKHDTISRSVDSGVIQRHSSFEHKMLGDVRPEDLEIIALGSNLNNAGIAVSTDPSTKAETAIKVTRGQHNGQALGVNRAMVLHTLDQEIERIKYWRDNPPTAKETRADYTQKLKDLDKERRVKEARSEAEMSEAENSEWQVRLVAIPSGDTTARPPYNPLLVTYGELNTLADIYGSSQELRDADPVNRYKVIQGIRQQSLFKFMDMRDKFSGTISGAISASVNNRPGQGFDDAVGSTGRGGVGPLAGGALGEVRLMMGGKKATGSKKEMDYKSGLGRNACHFAPESWHSWADYHSKARKKALEAYNLKVEHYRERRQMRRKRYADASAQLVDQAALIVKQGKIDQLENEALIENGFGDHFLQDSYAAGHLINKTEVMKWMVKWMDEKSSWYQQDYTRDENWRKNQAIAYNQPGVGYEQGRYDHTKVGTMAAKDPQSVENIQDDAASGTDWKTRFAALGLQLPSSVTPGSEFFPFTVRWQRYSLQHNTAKLTLKTARAFSISDNYTERVLRQLVKDGIARVNWAGTKVDPLKDKEVKDVTFILNSDYVPKDAKRFDQLYKDLYGKDANKKAAAQQNYKESAMKITYKNYHEFLNNATLQVATNLLHDEYCKNGLVVKSGKGDDLGRIYGDDHMMDKDSATGVKYSAQTANMSRDVIYDIFEHGSSADQATPITRISERFPAFVGNSAGANFKPIAQWHAEDVWKICQDEILPKVPGSAKALGGMGTLAGNISKDTKVHEGALF
jgi:hypothetical protein